jgi:hypothetical protein
VIKANRQLGAAQTRVSVPHGFAPPAEITSALLKPKIGVAQTLLSVRSGAAARIADQQ